MMNQYFNYENIKYWDAEKWKDRGSSIVELTKWIQDNDDYDHEPYKNAVDGLYGMDCRRLPFYHYKTNSVNPPEVIEYWKSRGVHYEYRSQGGVYWLIMAPVKCLDNYGKKLKTLLVFHKEDQSDPYWAMKTLERYKKYNDMVAEQQDIIVIYIVKNNADNDRIYINILQEAFVFVPNDAKNIWLDVSTVYNTGHKLSEIEGFTYKDDDGNVIDPDSAVVSLDPIDAKVLNISGRWENRGSLSRDQITSPNWSSQSFDLQRVIHSETGKNFAEGMALEFKYDSADDPGFIEYWAKMGLKYVSHETKARRWKAAVPMESLEHPEKKLPVICVFQEVNCANEHLAVTEASYFYEYFKIAAQGECMLINFVLEDPDSNDLLLEIIDDAEKLYPLDRSRIYIAGHSHNSAYSLEFSVRHPDVIAAVTMFGNPPGLQAKSLIPTTPEKAEKMRKSDVPIMITCGCSEASRFFPLNREGFDYRPQHGKGPHPVTLEERVKSWQLRLYASNCPDKTAEEIIATKDSPHKAIRTLGIPGDKSETLWLDGFEIYMVDVKNNNGKYHLRVVGEENLSHNTTPVQQKISWSFMRRFARDLETGESVEIY